MTKEEIISKQICLTDEIESLIEQYLKETMDESGNVSDVYRYELKSGEKYKIKIDYSFQKM